MDLEYLDERINNIILAAELEGEFCGLKHSRDDPSENHPATNYLCQRLGNNITKEVIQELRVFICNECSEALMDKEWILVYCVFCHKSQWINRNRAKYSYPPGNLIYWIDVCPFCAEIADEYKED